MAGMKRLLLVPLVAIASCAPQQHTWAPGPRAVGDIDTASGKCRMIAEVGAPDYSGAFIRGPYLTADMVGHHRKQQRVFDDCMQANGFVTADEGGR